MNSETVFFGLTTFRNQRKKFGIKTDDRRRHFYCIGKTGMGKSNLMENMAVQDIEEGRGVAYVDPHGEGATKLLDFVPAERINDVVYFNPADLDYPIAFNVMEKVDFRYRHLVAGGLMGVFKKVWPDVWSARMEYILNNTILALLEYPDSTLLGVNRMLADVEYREKVVSRITDPIIKSFWVTEYARYTQRYEIEATAAIQNKVGQFISNPLIRNIIGQTKSTINMRDIMDKEKIFIMDLAKGRIGEDNSRLLGALLITKLQLAAMSRVDIPEEDRKDFYLYVDEFQNFATESFANILSEARKYRLNITLGHQYITQMEEEVRDAVFGNVGTLAVFRVGAEDAEFLEREFTPEFTAEDLVNLPKYNIYLKLMIDGISSHPFSAETLAPPVSPESSNKEKIIRASQERYGIKKEIVEDKISRWSGFMEKKGGVQKKEPGDRNKKNNQRKPAALQDKIHPVKSASQSEAVSRKAGQFSWVKSGADNEKTVRPSSSSLFDLSPQILRGKTWEDKEVKISNIPFHSPKKRTEENISRPLDKKRKEINLSELRKALEESLAPLEEKIPKEEEKEKEEADKPGGNAEELKNTEEAKEEEKNNNKKGIIKPGETIKF